MHRDCLTQMMKVITHQTKIMMTRIGITWIGMKMMIAKTLKMVVKTMLNRSVPIIV